MNLFNVPFYQESWHGISLEDLQAKYGRNVSETSNDVLYGMFYEIFRQNGYNYSPEFYANKMRAKERIREFLFTNEAQTHKNKILSVGSGLGLIEESLIAEGFDIDLQECNNESFDFIRQKGIISHNRLIVSSDLKKISSDIYDIIYIHNVGYSLKPKDLFSLIKDCKRILKEDGTLYITGDGSYYWTLLKTLFFPHRGILWGWRRPWWTTVLYGKLAGFQSVTHTFLDSDFEPVVPETFLSVPINAPHMSDEFLFRKTLK